MKCIKTNIYIQSILCRSALVNIEIIFIIYVEIKCPLVRCNL